MNTVAFLRRLLLGATGPVALAEATALRTGTEGTMVDAWQLAAELLPHVTPDRFRLAAFEAGLELPADSSVDAYLLARERLDDSGAADQRMLRDETGPILLEAILDAGAWQGSPCDERPAELTVQATVLAGLPLVELAHDLATHLPGGLVVRTAPLVELLGLAAKGDTATPAVILLAEGCDDHTRAMAWAHELAHMLDPDMGGRRVAVAGKEAFAEELALVLLDQEPTTVAAAVPLVARIEAQMRTLRRRWPPQGDLPALLEYVVEVVRTTVGSHACGATLPYD